MTFKLQDYENEIESQICRQMGSYSIASCIAGGRMVQNESTSHNAFVAIVSSCPARFECYNGLVRYVRFDSWHVSAYANSMNCISPI